MKDMNRWKWVSQATERKIHLHNWANSLTGGRLGRVYSLEESLSCWKKKCSGFEKAKIKIDTLL